MLGNITFSVIFAVFDPSPLTLWINWFLVLIRLLAVCWPGTQSERDNHVLACNFSKYSPILKICPLADSPIRINNKRGIKTSKQARH